MPNPDEKLSEMKEKAFGIYANAYFWGQRTQEQNILISDVISDMLWITEDSGVVNGIKMQVKCGKIGRMDSAKGNFPQ